MNIEDKKKAPQEDKVAGFLQEFDFYKDLPKDIAKPTMVGASMSAGVLVVIGLLMFYQFVEYFRFQSTSEILVNQAEED